MSNIAPHDPVTLLMVFEVEPGRQAEMIADVTAIVARTTAERPGFISASFHACEDGRRVINYAQYASRAAFEAASAPGNATTPLIIEVLNRCGGRRVSVDLFGPGQVVRGLGARIAAA